MKIGINIVALLAAIAAVAVSYLNIAKVDERQADLEKNEKKERDLSNDLSDAEEELEASQKSLEEAQTAKAEVSTQIELVKSNLSGKKSEISRLDAKLDEQAGEIASLEALIAKLEEKLGPITLDELPSIIAKLEQNVKDARGENESVLALVEGAQAKLVSIGKDADSVREAIAKRAARIASNANEGVVLAANNDWEFVFLNKASGFEKGENLIVKRGGSYISKLKVTEVEAGGIIADIDQDSLARGARVRVGDRVIREVGKSQ